MLVLKTIRSMPERFFLGTIHTRIIVEGAQVVGELEQSDNESVSSCKDTVEIKNTNSRYNYLTELGLWNKLRRQKSITDSK